MSTTSAAAPSCLPPVLRWAGSLLLVPGEKELPMRLQGPTLRPAPRRRHLRLRRQSPLRPPRSPSYAWPISPTCTSTPQRQRQLDSPGPCATSRPSSLMSTRFSTPVTASWNPCPRIEAHPGAVGRLQPSP